MSLSHGPVSGHAHLWSLPDGTGLHAPYGELVADDVSGKICCHLCGRWFTFLGAHVRIHGLNAHQYRVELGLPRSLPLNSAPLSARMASRQRAVFEASSEMQEHFEVGQALARDGSLGRRTAANSARDPLPAASIQRRHDALSAGRRTQDRDRQSRVDDLLAEAGFADLAGYVEVHYVDADQSIEQISQDIGVGRATVRRVLLEAGVPLRAVGATTSAGRRSRALAADLDAARRVGVDDLGGWLVDRRQEGWTLGRMAQAVGHSSHWVRWRLERLGDPALLEQQERA